MVAKRSASSTSRRRWKPPYLQISRPFTEDMGYYGEPFHWDNPPGRRAQLRAELDAYHARLYGVTRDELRYATRLSASIRKKSTGRTLTCMICHTCAGTQCW